MTPDQEEHIGLLMLHAALKEGHQKGFPSTVLVVKPDMRFKSAVAEKILDFLEGKSLLTATQIARGTDLNHDSVRSSLRRMYKADAIHMERIEDVMHFRLLCNDPQGLGQVDKPWTNEERASVTA